MKQFTEEELEKMENIFVEHIHEDLKHMTDSNKTDLLEMLIDSLESMKSEI